MSYVQQQFIHYAPASVPFAVTGPHVRPYDGLHDYSYGQPAFYGNVEHQLAFADISEVGYCSREAYVWRPMPMAVRYDLGLPATPRVNDQVDMQSYNALSPHAYADRRPCLWGQCKILLDDHTTGGMKRHLKEHHKDASQLEQSVPVAGRSTHGALVCQWTLDDGRTCGSIYQSTTTLSRHISSYHMRVGRVTCTSCQTEFSRKDALKRHRRASCINRPAKETSGTPRRKLGRHAPASTHVLRGNPKNALPFGY